jgi:tetrahydromethanopterin S-methyltransferase subunit F
MTESQQIEFTQLKTQVERVDRSVQEMSSKTTLIYNALVGSELSKDGGLVQQIKDLEERQTKHESDIELRIEKLEDEHKRWKGIAAGLFFAGGIVGFLVKVILGLYLKK